jgi:hypothetical protein
VRVVVVGDVAHVIIDRPGSIDELVVRDFSEDLMKVAFDVVGWYGVVHSPDNHRYETDFAVTNPARLVFAASQSSQTSLTER